ncbi:atpase [Anaeramoeba flamelloides]|uniref:Atpase n=1 Tax=Anaeramoeba flamelloides TaxID=1746091 RepID=A0ABQ8YAA1_9EUKA|nr:atpase [Anaeramoeba flamelloides]
MEYLQELSKKYPLAKYLVHDCILKCLSLDVKTPFSSDSEYLSVMEVHLILTLLMEDSRNNILDIVGVPQPKNEPLNYEDINSLIESVKIIKKRVYEIREKKLALMETKPRIVRLCEKYKLTQKESLALEYILVNHVGTNLRGLKLRSYQEPITIALSCEMTIPEMLSFVSPNRQHNKQLYEYFDNTRILNNQLTFNSEIIFALTGQKLTGEQKLKIDNTVLSQVIEEEKTKTSREEEKEEVKEKEQKEKEKTETKKKIEFDDQSDLYKFISDQVQSEKELENKKGSQIENEKEDKKGGELERQIEKEIVLEKVEEEEEVIEKKKSEELDETEMKPYKTNLEYLEDHFETFGISIRVSNEKRNIAQNRMYGGSFQSEQMLRELLAKERVLKKKCEKRLKLTIEKKGFIPRMEKLSKARGLTKFEKNIVLFLIGSNISQEMMNSGVSRGSTVENLLRVFCDTLEDQITKRKYFYKSATLIKDGILHVSGTGLDNDLNSQFIMIDRRMLDFIMGLDSEINDLIEGSHLYSPKVKLENVILPEEQKKLIIETVSNYENFRKARKKLGLDEIISYGSGIVILFYGPSGTGKTMMANALGNLLKKKIMLVNFPSLGQNEAGENMKYIFREAKINQAILFFDECESIFESRSHGGYQVNILLTEIEKFDGIIILATNRAFDLDEGMHRRITIASEFAKPDLLLREKIWNTHIPKSLKCAEDVKLKELAMKFELTGGFIKNAVLSALSVAVSRDGTDNVTLNHKDLLEGAKLQLRGRLRMTDFSRRVVPQRGMEALILPKETENILNEIVNSEKARQILYNWGFDKKIGFERGTTCLFIGMPGTGKTLAAEAVGFEVGKPLKVINAAELLSKWVGDTPKNIDALFQEATTNDSILVFDEAEGLFGKRHQEQSNSTDRYANIDVGLLLYHMEKFSGICILCTNIPEAIDKAFFRRMKFIVEFKLPNKDLRKKLWPKLIPKSAPKEKDIDFDSLAGKFEFPGGNIKNVVFRAASRAALRENEDRIIKYSDLLQAGNEELLKIKKSRGESSEVIQSIYF